MSKLTTTPLSFTYSSTFKEAANLKNDTIYLLLIIKFTNDNGKPQKPFERMFTIYNRVFNNQLPEATSEQYENVKKYLISIGKWPK